MIKSISCLISLFLLVSLGRADGISISQSLEKTSIAYEDSVEFEIELQWNGPQSAYRFGKPLNLQIDRLKVRGFSSSIASQGSGSDEITTKAFRYMLIPTSSGSAHIEPATIDYITWPDSIPGELVTEGMTVRIAEPKPVEPQDRSTTIWVIVLIVLTGGVVVGIVLVRRSRNRKSTQPVQTPQERFLEELALVKDESGSDLKKFQTGLYRILAEFLDSRYGITTERLSDEGLARALDESDLAEEIKKKICEYIVKARQDKFRPVTAVPGETVRLEAEIRKLFEEI
ncbi:MAG: hypothetical protein U9R56_07575 [candidate division Zixibacteria bacterium]|nr:hypothetical protein [candidate division Zixibacteria bacterium]